MRRILALFTAVLMFVGVLMDNSCAVAEMGLFSIRNGISFGMSKEEVKRTDSALLSQDYAKELVYDGVTIAGIKGCRINYLFNDSGALHRIVINLYPESDKYVRLAAAEPDYVATNNALISKYGEPLGNSDGYTHSVQTHTLEFHQQMVDLQKLLIAIQGAGKLSEQYDEWVRVCADGYVKIDHVFQHLVGIYGTTTCTHKIEYCFYSESEWNEAMQSFADDL